MEPYINRRAYLLTLWLSVIGGFLTLYWVFRAFDFSFSETFFLVGYFTLIPFIVANILCRSFDCNKLGLQLISIAIILSIASSYYFYNDPFGVKSYPMVVKFLMGPFVVKDGYAQSFEMLLVPLYQLAFISLAMSASKWIKPNTSAK